MRKVTLVKRCPPRSVEIAALALFWATLTLTFQLPSAWGHDPQDLVFGQVGVDERLGERVPTELSFTDQKGQQVQLSRYFTGGPVLLTLNYFSCPTLCPLTAFSISRRPVVVSGPKRTKAASETTTARSATAMPQGRKNAGRFRFVAVASGALVSG